jgi:hypothetical protein
VPLEGFFSHLVYGCTRGDERSYMLWDDDVGSTTPNRMNPHCISSIHGSDDALDATAPTAGSTIV